MAERSAVELSSFGAAGVDDSDVEDDETARLTRGSADGDEDDPNASKVGTRDASGVPRHLATWQTAAYTLGFVILGLLVGLIGPALPALRENVGVSFERLGAVFLFRWMGSISGSALGGALLDARPRSHVPYAVSALIAAAGAACIPLARSLRAVVAAFLVMDFGLGVLITQGNTLCVWANQKNPAPAVNVINGGFGAGAFCAPLALVAARASGGGVKEAYWCVALAAAATAAVVLRVAAPGPPEARFEDETAPSATPSAADGTPKTSAAASRRKMFCVTASIALFVALVVGVEISFGAFLVTYARAFGVPEPEADLITAAFWGSFTIGRFLMATASRRVRPAPAIAAHLAVTALSLALVGAGRGERATLWCGSVGFGFGMSSLFAAAVAQLHEVSGGVRGSGGGWIGAGASSGTLVQLAVSRASGSPDALMGTLLALTCAASAVMCGGVWGAGVGFRRSFVPARIAVAGPAEDDEREARV